MSGPEWIGIAAIMTSLVLGFLSYIRKPSFVSAASADELRRMLDETRKDNDHMAGRIVTLELQVKMLRDELLWWQGAYQRLKIEVNGDHHHPGP
jgi:hypothetical protein